MLYEKVCRLVNIVVDKNNPLIVSAFAGLGNIIPLGSSEITPAAVHDADALIVRSENRVDRALLEGSKVSFVGTATIGTDHIDLEYLHSRGIAFASAPGSNANSVKEYVVAALVRLSHLHQLPLRDASIGIIGVGSVGSRVAEAARLLGMRVLSNDPPRAQREGDSGFVSLSQALQADFVTVHVPLTKSGDFATHHLMNSDRFGEVNPGAVFINTSRGAVVDTAALLSAVQQGRISYAVIDVWEGEPLIDLELLENVSIASAHIAGYSFDGKLNAVRAVREALCRHFGLENYWHPGELPHGPADLILTESDTPNEDLLHTIVSHAYDIALDDRQIRQLFVTPAEARGEYFRKLRSGYRIRREFAATTIHVPSRLAEFGNLLAGLGFSVRPV